ncbi:MAP3K12-binding inhibitory protein 1-like [Babylonia areolata]|uniref:MAP3K12-binding inhibitory protein 1-like n=1 Tax=Babylonia areolata TaxID=304850 RepID=UPI003FD2B8C4
MSQEMMDFLTSSCSTSEESSRNSMSDTENDNTVDSSREAEPQRAVTTDQSLVQIRASTSEVKRRIAAFMASKRAEVSDNNIREFCFDLPCTGTTGDNGEEMNSCARVDAVYVSRVGCTSRVRVTRVLNTQGPQTQAGQREGTQAGRSTPTLFRSSVEERLRNAEQHLNITSDTKADLFSRLKAVEEGILFLSGISPEYFESGKMPQPKVKRRKVSKPEPVTEDLSPTKLKTEYDSISEIDQRMFILRSKLKEQMKYQSP